MLEKINRVLGVVTVVVLAALCVYGFRALAHLNLH